MIAIEEQNLDLAWVAATSALLDAQRAPGCKAHHVVVGFPVGPADPRIRQLVDRFLADAMLRKPDAGILRVETVANTIFPEAFYLPSQAADPREHLYETHQAKMRFHRRRLAHEKETYFSRLTGTNGTDERGLNQLEPLIVRMKHQLSLTSPKSSIYELAVSDVSGDLRVQLPGRDRSIMGFPCLSHISITMNDGALHLTTQYRNQHFIRKALGNYLGLSRLCTFVATEVGLRPGSVCCVAAHADAEVGLGIGGTRRYRKLLEDCRRTGSTMGGVANVV